MASELLKNKTLIQRLKEPDVPVVNFNLADSALDYSIESIEEELSTPTERVADLADDLTPGPLRDELKGTFDPTQETYEEYLRRINARYGGRAKPKRGLVDEPGSYGGRSTTKSLGGGLYEVTYKGGSKTYYTKIYDRETGKDIKKFFGSDKEAATESLKKQKADRSKTKFEKIKEVKETKGTKEFKKITDKIDKKFNKVKSKGYTNLMEFRDEIKNLVTKDKFRNQFEIQRKLSEYITDKFKNIEDVNTSNMEKALDKYNRIGGKERGTINKIASEFGVNKGTLEGSIQKTGRKKIPIKYGSEYEKRKAVSEKRLKAEKKFSDPSFEAKMSGTKAVQKSHMDDLYSKVVTAETLGYAPDRINQEILKDVDAYLSSLYKKRDKLLKDKPEGYKQAVEEINQKGIKVAQATDGYKSFQIERPDGSTYQFGVEPGKTIDPTGITEGKQIKGGVEKVQFEGGKKPTATLTPDPVDQYFFEENRKAVMEAQAKVSQTEMDKIAKELEEMGFDTDPFFKERKKKLTALQELSQRAGSGIDPILAARATKEEFIDPVVKVGSRALPFAAKGVRGALTAADLALSVGKGTTGLLLGALIEADPILTAMAQGKTFRQGARDTFIGSAIDAIPGVDLGSLGTDLLKLADTEEQKVAVQNLLDYQKDFDKFNKDLTQFREYEDTFEESGLTRDDLINMEKDLIERYTDIQERGPKVINPDTETLFKSVARKEAEKRFENLDPRSFQMKSGSEFIDKQTDQIFNALVGYQGATDRFQDEYKNIIPTEISEQDLDEIYEMGGIMGAAEGGRIGFAEGPMNPKRRLFLKLMTGIMALPIIPKFMKQAEVAKPVVKLANTTTKMPDWFPDLITKVMFKSPGKKVDADIMLYEVKELPGIKIYKQGDGKIRVEGENEYGKPYQIDYEPPGYELVDESGKSFKTKGNFSASEDVPVSSDPDGNMDFDVEVLEDLDQILGSDTRIMEEFATGKKVEKMKSGEFALGKAEADLERAAEEAAEEAAFYDEID